MANQFGVGSDEFRFAIPQKNAGLLFQILHIIQNPTPKITSVEGKRKA